MTGWIPDALTERSRDRSGPGRMEGYGRVRLDPGEPGASPNVMPERVELDPPLTCSRQGG